MIGSPHALLEDPFVSQEIDRALAGFAGALDPDEIAWMREALAHELAGDPKLLALLDAAHPRVVDASGERDKPWLGESQDEADVSGER